MSLSIGGDCNHQNMNVLLKSGSASSLDAIGTFDCHPLGYIRHWLVAGPRETLYQGPTTDENVLRNSALDHRQVEPPAPGALGGLGPFGEPWWFYYPGANFFVEHSAFHAQLVILDSYAFVEVESAQETACEARLWVAGLADLWVNEVHITRFAVTRYMYPDFLSVTLPLRRGVNRICIRLQCLGVRDTRVLFGLQLMHTTGIVIRIPGCAPLMDAVKWLDSVRTEGPDAVVSFSPAPKHASVFLPGVAAISWPAGGSRLSFGASRPFQLAVQVADGGQTLRRLLEIPANRTAYAVEATADVRTTRLEFIAGLTVAATVPLNGKACHLPLLARRLLGRTLEIDSTLLDAILAFIDGRSDCADFALATLLRLEALKLTTGEESAKIRRTALAFRYWSDEPGADAMCYWSENHSLLFHGCQLIAGRLYPADVFSNSNRTGEAQAALGAARCREWFDRIESRGFEEFNSGTYLPITVGALLNVVDFCGDVEMSRRAAALIDRLYEDLASHAFDGIVISPQGRVYRNVLYPEESGTQAILSDATSKAPPEFLNLLNSSQPHDWTGDWIVYQASSPVYRPPAYLDALIQEPVSKRYRQAGVEIVLHKTKDWLLTSLSIPAPIASLTEDAAAHLMPGRAGYQQHLWQATLGRECHVFVNHPGCSYDHAQSEPSPSRPGYWYGNGVLPRLRQREGVLEAIFDIPDGSLSARDRESPEYAWAAGPWPNPFDLHPIPFTHVHWPSDAFDRWEVREHWLFGQKGGGCIGLWCSEPLTPHDDVLAGREFRAWAHRSAWLVVCEGLAERGSFRSFIESCLARQPEFDSGGLSLRMKGGKPLFY